MVREGLGERLLWRSDCLPADCFAGAIPFSRPTVQRGAFNVVILDRFNPSCQEARKGRDGFFTLVWKIGLSAESATRKGMEP